MQVNNNGSVALSGGRAFAIKRRGEIKLDRVTSFRQFLAALILTLPFVGTASREVTVYRVKNLPNIWRGFWRVAIATALGIPTYYGAVYAQILRNGQVIDLGCISLRVVTTAGVGYLVDALQNLTEPENFKYHGFGTGTTAEASGDTALVTELTTEYQTNSTRPTGSQTEGASANIYRTVATLTPDSGGVIAITEHGVFSANAAGTLLDRSKFSALNLDSANGDSLQITYDLTLPAGG